MEAPLRRRARKALIFGHPARRGRSGTNLLHSTAPVSRRSASAAYSLPPAAIESYLETYGTRPDELDAPALLILARAFERMGCDEQALDCANRAAQVDPESKPDAVAVAKKCIGRNSRPM